MEKKHFFYPVKREGGSAGLRSAGTLLSYRYDSQSCEAAEWLKLQKNGFRIARAANIHRRIDSGDCCGLGEVRGRLGDLDVGGAHT